MREATGTTTTFKYILVFTFLFAGFLAVAISYSRVFRLKNGSLAIIEKYEGVSDKSLGIINNYLVNSGYTEKGKCEEGKEYGVSDLNTTNFEKAKKNETYYYCLKLRCNYSGCKIKSDSTIMYDLSLFYKFKLPIMGDLINFKIRGQTKAIKLYSAIQKLERES